MNENLKTAQTQPLRETNVDGSITLKGKMPPEFAKAVIDLHDQYNVKLIEMSDLHEKGLRNDNWKVIVVNGLEEDLIKLNNHCKKLAYGAV